jgi:hypothetical protein
MLNKQPVNHHKSKSRHHTHLQFPTQLLLTLTIMPDGCYLVNGTGPNGQQRSGVAYYNPFLFAGGNDNTQPADFAYTNYNGYTTWEELEQSRFSYMCGES